MSESPSIAEAPEEALAEAKQKAGSGHALARLLRLTPSAINQWKRVPAERVLAVEAATGVSRSRLRPDLYPLDAPAEKSGEAA
jgi:DNA-binding transcriptional regulator YdaS (Cro superfamily)